MSSVELLPQYVPNDNVRRLHNLPHKNFAFQDVDSTFRPENQDYQQSIAMCATTAVTFGLLTLLYFCGRHVLSVLQLCCCNGKRRWRKQKIFKDRPVRLVYLFSVVVLLAISSVVYGSWCNTDIVEGIDALLDSLRRMDNARSLTTDQATAVREKVDLTRSSSSDLDSTLMGLQPPLSISLPTATFASIDAACAAGSSQLNTAIDTYADVPINDAFDTIDDYDEIRSNAQLGLLCLLLMPFALAILVGICGVSRASSSVLTISAFVGFIGWIVTGLETSTAVMFGDFCFDPNTYMLTKASDLGDSAAEYAEYYVVCHNISSPMDVQIKDAIAQLEEAQTGADDIYTFVQAIPGCGAPSGSCPSSTAVTTATYLDLVDAATALKLSVNQTLESLIDLDLTCEEPHSALVASLEGMCHTGLGGLIGLVVVQGATCTGIWVAMYVIIKLASYYRSRRKDVVREVRKSVEMTDEKEGDDAEVAKRRKMYEAGMVSKFEIEANDDGHYTLFAKFNDEERRKEQAERKRQKENRLATSAAVPAQEPVIKDEVDSGGEVVDVFDGKDGIQESGKDGMDFDDVGDSGEERGGRRERRASSKKSRRPGTATVSSGDTTAEILQQVALALSSNEDLANQNGKKKIVVHHHRRRQGDDADGELAEERRRLRRQESHNRRRSRSRHRRESGEGRSVGEGRDVRNRSRSKSRSRKKKSKAAEGPEDAGRMSSKNGDIGDIEVTGEVEAEREGKVGAESEKAPAVEDHKLSRERARNMRRKNTKK